MVRLLIPLLLASWLAALGAAESVLQREQPLNLPHRESNLPVDPAVTWGVMENGVHYAVRRHPEPAGKVSFRLYVRAGALQETDPQRGIAHYLEHMAFNGSENFKPGELVAAFQNKGVAFGQQFNAHTGFEETVYKIDMPDTEADSLNLAGKALVDIAAYLTLSSEELDRERGVILAEYRDRDSPQFRFWLESFKHLYAGTVIPNRFPIGTVETIEAIDHELMSAYYRQWYRPDRMVVTAVGDCEPAILVAVLKEHFGKIPAANATMAAPPIMPVEPGLDEFYFHHDPELSGTSLSVTAFRYEAPRPDTKEERRRALVLSVAEQIMQRRFADLAEQADAPILGGSLGAGRSFKHHLVRTSVTPKPGKIEAAIGVLENEQRRLLLHGVTEAEIAVAVEAIRSQLRQAVERQALVSQAAHATRMYMSIRDDQVLLSPEQKQALYEPWLEKITPAAVAKLVQEVSNKNTRQVVVLSTPEETKFSDESLAIAWSMATARPVTAPVDNALVAWGYGSVSKLPPAVAPTTLDHGILAASYPNQVEARVLPRSAKPNEVLIRVTMPIAPGPRPIGLPILAGAFGKAGLGKHNASDLRQILAGKSARVGGPSIGDDVVTFSASCPPDELAFALQWLRAALTDPGWREDVYERHLVPLPQALLAQQEDLDWRMNEMHGRLTMAGLGYRQGITADQVPLLHMGVLRDWLSPILAEAPLELAIVGDVDGSAALAEAATWFGTLPQRQPMPVADDALYPVPPMVLGTHEFTYTGSNDRTVVWVSWPTDDVADIIVRRKLGVVGQVLRELLRADVREALGQAYSPNGWHDGSQVFDGEGALHARIAVAPGLDQVVLETLQAGLDRLAAEGVTEDLFNRIITPTRKGIESYRNGNGYWLGSVVARSSNRPQQLDWANSMVDFYNQLSAEEVNEYFKRYITDAGDQRLVVIGTSRKPAEADEAATESTADPAQP